MKTLERGSSNKKMLQIDTNAQCELRNHNANIFISPQNIILYFFV